MKQIKFKAFSEKLGMSDPMELRDLISRKTNFFKYDVYLQYL